MKKKITTILILATIAIMLVPGAFAWFSDNSSADLHITSYLHKSYFESGDGTTALQYAGSSLEDDSGCAFEIKYPIQFYYFSWLQYLGYFNQAKTEAGHTSEIDQVYFYLSDNIDMSGFVLPPVGTVEFPFLGNFDGNGHTISNLTVQNVASSNLSGETTTLTDVPEAIGAVEIVGVFGVVGSTGTKGQANASQESAGDFISTSGYGFTYDTDVNKIVNFKLNSVTLKANADSEKALIGAVAGYLNAPAEKADVVGATLVIASGTTAVTSRDNISDYSVVGYYNGDLSSSYTSYAEMATGIDEAHSLETALGGGGPDDGNDWGGSIDMLNIYKRLTMMEYEYFTSYGGENITGYSTAGEYNFLTNLNPRFVFLYGGPATDYSGKLNETQRNNIFKEYNYEFAPSKSDGFYIRNSDGDYMNISSDGTELVAGASPTTTWKITDGYLYGTTNITFTISSTNSVSRDVVRFAFISGVNIGLSYSPVSDSDVWSLDGSGKLLVNGNAGTVVYYDGTQWKIDNGVAQYRITDRNGHYLKLNAALNGFENSNEANATLWTFIKGSTYSTGTNYTICSYVNGYYYFISCNKSGSTYTLSVYRSSTDSAVSSYRNFRIPTGSTITTTLLKLISYPTSGQLTYSSGWKYSTNGNAYAVENVVSIDESSKATTVTQVNSVYAITNISALLSPSDVSFSETYFPLLTSQGSVGARQDNIGYVISGSNYSESDPIGGWLTAGDIRFSEYFTTDLSGSSVGDITDNDSTATIYTITPDGTHESFTDNMFKDSDDEVYETLTEDYGLTQYYDKKETIAGEEQTIAGAKSRFFGTTLREGAGYIYGLHFMNATIGKSNTFTATKGVWISNTYYASGYEFPRDCIDFNVSKEGKITFFAGTYFEGNNAFFSLYEVNRTGSTIDDVNGIREIKKIYRNNTTKKIEYTYDDSTKGDGYTLLFDTANITDPSTFNQNSIYYFEIPVKPGEYLLGSVNGKIGAYLMYLDISASGGGKEQVVTPGTSLVETITQTTYHYGYVPGVGVTADGAQDGVAAETISSPVASDLTKPLTYSGMTKVGYFIRPPGDTVTDSAAVVKYLGKTVVITQRTTITGTVNGDPTTIIVTKTTTLTYDASDALTNTANTISATKNGVSMDSLPTGFEASTLSPPAEPEVSFRFYNAAGGITVTAFGTNATITDDEITVTEYTVTTSSGVEAEDVTLPDGASLSVNGDSVAP